MIEHLRVDSMPKQKRQLAKAPSRPAPPEGPERLYTVDQLALLGGPCRAKLYEDIKAGLLKARKFGRSTRITGTEWLRYIESAPTL